MTPVRAGHVIVLVQVGHEPCGDGLFSGVEVHETGDLARGELGVQPLLEPPYRPHNPIDVEQLFLAQLLRSRNLRHGFPFLDAYPANNPP